jgi:hypothetical protein
MVPKNSWMSWLSGDNTPYQPGQYGSTLTTYGLEVSGTQWIGDNPHGLSPLAAIVQAERGNSFPVVYVGLASLPDPSTLPTLLRMAQCVTTTDQSCPAQVVAAAFSPPQVSGHDVRLSVYDHLLLGRWLDVGLRDETWNGCMFGVSEGAAITHYAVGPKGILPELAVPENQRQGMQAHDASRIDLQ